MGIELPDLDDRTHEKLRAEAEALLSAHGEVWSDRGAHDPGVTVVELLAWLTETYGYQLDRITDDHRRKFLELLGECPRSPEPASAVLSLSLSPESAGRLPGGTPLTASEGGEHYRFETAHDVTVAGTRIERIFADGMDVTRENERPKGSFRAFGDDPGVGDALRLGFDADPFGTAETVTLWLRLADDHLPDPAPGRFEPSVELVWERYLPEAGAWRPLDIRHDGARKCYESGRVTLSTRTDAVQYPADDPPGEAGTTWLRCRIDTPGYEFPPELSTVRADCVAVHSGRSVVGDRLQREREVGEPRGLDSQRYAFEHTPVREVTVSVDGHEWTRVNDFDAAGPDDCVYVLDREAGTLTFGDGVHGAVPSPDATVAASYTAGGGADANVSADATWAVRCGASSELSGTDIDIAPLGEATGGRDGESITAALDRARREQRRHQRAVTEADYREVVSRTPGTRIARTNVRLDGNGTTVVIVPAVPSDVRRPRPSEGMVAAVEKHLRERTLLGEPVTVRGPRYVDVDVEVLARTRADAEEATVERAVSRFVHPLADDGWPFGRSLRPDAVAEVLGECEAVHRIEDVTVTPQRPDPGVEEAVPLDERSLFAVGDVALQRPGGHPP